MGEEGLEPSRSFEHELLKLAWRGAARTLSFEHKVLKLGVLANGVSGQSYRHADRKVLPSDRAKRTR